MDLAAPSDRFCPTKIEATSTTTSGLDGWEEENCAQLRSAIRLWVAGGRGGGETHDRTCSTLIRAGLGRMHAGSVFPAFNDLRHQGVHHEVTIVGGNRSVVSVDRCHSPLVLPRTRVELQRKTKIPPLAPRPSELRPALSPQIPTR